VKSAEEIMEILEAYDLTGSYREAGEPAGCAHPHGRRLCAGVPGGPAVAGSGAAAADALDAFLPKLEEWVDRSRGKIRADVAHEKLVALGYAGSERTTRRAVAEVKAGGGPASVGCTGRGCRSRDVVSVRLRHRPRIAGVATWLFCAWLAWCRFRVVLAILVRRCRV